MEATTPKTPKKSFLKNQQRKLIAILFIVIISGALFLTMPVYLRNALIYGYSGIYDYKIFHNRTVAAGFAHPWPLSEAYNTATPSEVYIDSLKLLGTTGFVVIRNDSLLFEYYSDEADTNTISNSFSMAKSIVGLLTGCAIEDGYLNSIHQPIDQFLTDFEHLKGKGITLQHLLTMSSGSNWDEKYSSLFSKTTKAYYGNHLEKLMQEVEIVETPGVNYRYKSGDTQLLAMVLTRATGKSLSAYASEKLWQPMGAETPALWSTDKKRGLEKAYCCFNSTARDFARFGSLILHLGQWDGQQLVPESYVIESITPASFLKDEQNKPLTFYGYQWWILHYRGRAIPYARGLHGQYIFVLPAENAVIVRLGHERSDVEIHNHPLDVYSWVNMGLELLE